MFDDEPDDLGDLLDSLSSLRDGIPSVELTQVGNQIHMLNFKQVVQVIKRDDRFLSRFISNQLGAKTTIRDSTLIIRRQINRSDLEDVLHDFVSKYVICPTCSKPDTILEGTNQFKLICLACGTENHV